MSNQFFINTNFTSKLSSISVLLYYMDMKGFVASTWDCCLMCNAPFSCMYTYMICTQCSHDFKFIQYIYAYIVHIQNNFFCELREAGIKISRKYWKYYKYLKINILFYSIKYNFCDSHVIHDCIFTKIFGYIAVIKPNPFFV